MVTDDQNRHKYKLPNRGGASMKNNKMRRHSLQVNTNTLYISNIQFGR